MNPLSYQNGGVALTTVNEDVPPLRGRAVSAAAVMHAAVAPPGFLAGQPPVAVDGSRLAVPPQFYPGCQQQQASLVASSVSLAGAEGPGRPRPVLQGNGHSPVIAQAVSTQSPLPQQVMPPPNSVLMAQQAPAGSQAPRANGTAQQQTVQGQTVQGQTVQGQAAQGQTVQGQTVQGQTVQGQTVQGKPAPKRAKGGKDSPGLQSSPSLVVTNDGAILLQQTVPLPAASLPAAAVSVQAAQAALQGAGSLLPPTPEVAMASSAAPMVDSAGNVRQVLMMMSGSQRLAVLPVVRPDKVLPAPPAALQGHSPPAPAPQPVAVRGAWPPATQVEVFCAVECQTRGGWAEATVVLAEPELGRVRVRLQVDATEERVVPLEHVRDSPTCESNFACAPGQAVEMRWHALWCEGEIVEVRPPPQQPSPPVSGQPTPAAGVQTLVRLSPNGELAWCEAAALRRRVPLLVAGPSPIAAPVASTPAQRGRSPSPFAIPTPPLQPGAKPSPTSSAGTSTGPSPHADFAFKRPRAPSSRERSPKRRPPSGSAADPAFDNFSLSVINPSKLPSIVVPSPHGASPQPSPTATLASAASAKRTLSAEPQVTTATRGPNGQEFVRLVVPQGVTGGQTLLLSVQRPPEQMELVLPAGVANGDTVLAHTLGGDPVHVPVPTGATAGQRLLLSVPLPAQSLCVCLPAAAQPGRQVQFPLPAPSSELEQTWDGPTSASSQPSRSRDRSRERRDKRSPRAETPPDSGASAATPPLPLPRKRERGRERGSSSGAAADRSPGVDDAQEEALALVRHFDATIEREREQPKPLRQLRAMPEMVETWLLCQVLRPRLQLPQLPLEQLERALCNSMRAAPARRAPAAGGDASPATPSDSDTSVLSELHCRLLEGLRAAKVPSADGAILPPASPPVPAPQLPRDGSWPQMLFVALQAGLWARAHPEAPLPMWRPPSAEGGGGGAGKRPNRIGGKFGQWVTERGPAMCGTFGCVLLNNHSGLHKLPDGAADRPRGARLKRKEQLPGEDDDDDDDPPCKPVTDGPSGLPLSLAEPYPGGAPAAQSPGGASQEAVTAAAIASLTAAAAAPGPDTSEESAALYAAVMAPERLLMLRCLCRALLSGGERQALQRTVASCHIGADTEGAYWLLPAEHRLYRAPLGRGGAGGSHGALPLSSRWQSLAVARHELLRFAQLLDRAGGGGADATGGGSHAALSAGALGARNVLDAMRPLFEPHELAPPAAPRAPLAKVAARSGGAAAAAAAGGCNGGAAAAATGSSGGAGGLRRLGAAGGACAGGAEGSERSGPVHVKASLRACKVPVGHRVLAVRAVLKLSIPRQRRPSSTMRWRQEDTGAPEVDGGGSGGGSNGAAMVAAAAAASAAAAAAAAAAAGAGAVAAAAAAAAAHKRAAEGHANGLGHVVAHGKARGKNGGAELFEVEEIRQRRMAPGGEPQFLVKWKGFGHEDDTWEPWSSRLKVPAWWQHSALHQPRLVSRVRLWAALRTPEERLSRSDPSGSIHGWCRSRPNCASTPRWNSLVGPCLTLLRSFHAARLASGELRPQWAAACPASFEVDAELPNWRVQAKRTSAGREYRVFFGPFGEHVRSRVSALQLASLYAVPEAVGLAMRSGSGEAAAGTNAVRAVAGSSG